MTDWVRLWHDMPTDPKWRTIARKSGQRVGDVIAVFNFLMVNASGNAVKRGTLSGFDIEDVATALDLSDADVEAIIAAMQGKVLDGDELTGWERRQPKREDNSAERVKAYRDRKKSEPNASERTETQVNVVKRIVTQRNAPETETETDITVAKATDAGASPDKAFWANAIAYLGEGKRSMVGKWIKDHGQPETAKAIAAAQVERTPDPVAYINGVLRKGRAAKPAPVVGI